MRRILLLLLATALWGLCTATASAAARSGPKKKTPDPCAARGEVHRTISGKEHAGTLSPSRDGKIEKAHADRLHRKKPKAWRAKAKKVLSFFGHAVFLGIIPHGEEVVPTRGD